MVYEPRREERAVERLPSDAVRAALAATVGVWAELADQEADLGLPTTREPEFGFAWAIYRWARGESLERVLDAVARGGNEMSAGDFIRWCKQVLDLLGQLAADGPGREPGAGVSIEGLARDAAAAIRRGVVAQSMQP